MTTEMKAVCFAAALVLAASGASANVLYAYTGNDFTMFTSPYGPSDKVTAEVELPAALGPNFPFQEVTPLAFFLFDGNQNLTGTQTLITSSFAFSTDSSGNINSWGVSATFSLFHNSGSISTSNTTSSISDIGFEGFVDASFSGANEDDPGVWRLVTPAIPEPSDWTMMLIGFAGLSALGYRASRRRAALA